MLYMGNDAHNRSYFGIYHIISCYHDSNQGKYKDNRCYEGFRLFTKRML